MLGGGSYNTYSSFDVGENGGVILNNSMTDGISTIGGKTSANPNLTSNYASLIVNEIQSGVASSLNGTIEVFGKSADIIFANENGFSINGASFLNTNGLTLGAATINGDKLNATSNGFVDILENGIGVDGSYFNVISRAMNIAGTINSLNEGQTIENINLIAGKNEVDISDRNHPYVVSTDITKSDDKLQYAIDGSSLGSMYANSIKLVSTESGVGVRHQGVISGVDDILIMSNGDIDTALTTTNGAVRFDAKGDITTSYINANDIYFTSTQDVLNTGVLNANNDIYVTANSFINSDTLNAIFSGTEVDMTKVTANNIYFNVSDLWENNGSVNANNNLQISSSSFTNSGSIGANNIDLYLNNFDNFNNLQGKIAAKNDITISVENGDVNIDDSFGEVYSQNALSIYSTADIFINTILQNIGSIKFDTDGDITVNAVVASASGLNFNAMNINNESYIYSDGSATFNASKSITNNGTLDIGDTLDINTNTLTNGYIIFALGDVNIEAKTVNNNISLYDGASVALGDIIYGDGYVDYGDTAFKVWKTRLTYQTANYDNSLYFNRGSITSAKNVNINKKSQDKSSQINNYGLISAGGDVDIVGNINKITLTQEISVTSLLSEMILTSDLVTKEYLGSWNTATNSSLPDAGQSIYSLLTYLANSNIKNHQKEVIYNAIKAAANKDDNLNQALSLLLGSDYMSKKFIPSESEWNKSASYIFTPNVSAVISSGEDIAILANNVLNSTNIDNMSDVMYAVVNQTNDTFASIDNLSKYMPSTGETSIFQIAQEGDKQTIDYYIETRLDFLLGNQTGENVYSAEYLLKNLGYDTSSSIIIGDAYYEYKLLSNMYAALASSTLTTSDIKSMYDAAIQVSDTLGLEIGKELSEEQMQKLTKDIIWYVQTDIDGKSMLAPVIYLAQTDSPNATMMAGNDITISADNITNYAENIVAGGNVKLIASDTITNFGSSITGKNVSMYADKINISSVLGIDENGAQTAIYQSTISATNDVLLNSQGDTNIANSTIAAGGAIAILADDINIVNNYFNESSFNQEISGSSMATTMQNQDGILTSSLTGTNIYMNANNDINITASDLTATNNIGLNASNVNIQGAYDTSSIVDTYSFSGVNEATKMLELSTTSSSEYDSSLYVGSNIAANNIVINADNNISVVGSNLASDNDMTLQAKSIAIKDGRNEISSTSQATSFQILGYNHASLDLDSSLSSGSNLFSGGNLNLIADEGVITGSKVNVGKKLNLDIKNLTLAAGENTTSQNLTNHSLGVVTSASFGVAGTGMSASWNSVDSQTTTSISEDKLYGTSSNSALNTGGVGYDSIFSTDVAVEFAYTNQTIDQTYWTLSDITANDVNLIATGSADVGGGDITALNNIKIIAPNVQTTKYVDTIKTTETDISVYLKQAFSTSSLIANLANQAANNVINATNGNNINGGIAAAQLASNTIGLVLGNGLFSQSSTQSIGIKASNSESYSTAENITHITAGNTLFVQSTEGDVTFNGVLVSAKNVKVDAKENFNINAAKATSESESFSIGAMIKFNQSAGVSVAKGGSTAMGLGIVLDGGYSNSDSTSYTNSQLNATNMSVSTGNDWNIFGGNVSADNIALGIGNDLNIASAVDTSNSKDFSMTLSASAAIGLSTNTVFTGDGSVGIGMGISNSSANSVGAQSSIIANNSLITNVGNDINLTGAALGSLSNTGSITMGGELNHTDIALFERGDGASVMLGIGNNGTLGADIDIDDHISVEGTLASAVNLDINNQIANISDDIINTQTLTDNSWAGGSMSLNFSTTNIKNGANSLANLYSWSETLVINE